jgi:phosphate transport system substrate-binding protein
MQMKRTLVALATVSAVLGGIAGTSVPAMAESKLIQIDGSSTVYPITEAVAEEFQKAKKGAVRVTVGISGTGGGFKKFCRGELDIADASRPITSKEMAACKEAGIKYIEMPVAFDALTVVIHKDNTWANEMTVAELKTMWEPDAQGKITNWKQVNPKFPDMPLALFGPAPTPARSSTSPRRSTARPSRAAATSPRVRTTTCWCRAWRATRAVSATSVWPITSRTGTS